MRIEWLRTALSNLDTEAEYTAKDNPAAATRTVHAIIVSVEQLKRFPAIGRPGRVVGTRELVVPGKPYIIPYRLRGDVIQILRVFHGARRWHEKF